MLGEGVEQPDQLVAAGGVGALARGVTAQGGDRLALPLLLVSADVLVERRRDLGGLGVDRLVWVTAGVLRLGRQPLQVLLATSSPLSSSTSTGWADGRRAPRGRIRRHLSDLQERPARQRDRTRRQRGCVRTVPHHIAPDRGTYTELPGIDGPCWSRTRCPEPNAPSSAARTYGALPGA